MTHLYHGALSQYYVCFYLPNVIYTLYLSPRVYALMYIDIYFIKTTNYLGRGTPLMWATITGIFVVYDHVVNIVTKDALLMKPKLCNPYLVQLHDKHESCTPRHSYLACCCCMLCESPRPYSPISGPPSSLIAVSPPFLFLWGKGDCQV